MTATTLTFQLGDPVEHRGIVITPLFPVCDSVASYITLDEALPRGLTISETSDAGSVPELAVINPLDVSVLLYDGEELVGAKQNRILNVSVLVGAGARLPIPVSCVEQGRWARSSTDFDFALLWPKLRAGYLLDALERLDQTPTSVERIAGFVDEVADAPVTRGPSAGLGEDVRLRGPGVIGSGLELDGERIQLSAFTSDGGADRAFGRIARPSRRR